MFGKDQPNVVTDEDVGNFIKQLHEESDPMKYIEVEDGLVRDSTESTSGKEDVHNVSRMR